MDANPQQQYNGPAIILSWDAPILPRHNRTLWWYVGSGAIALAVAIYSFIVKAWSVGLVAPLCWLMYLLIAEHEPKIHTISITESGILLDQKFTRFDELLGFWFLHTPQYTELHFVRRNHREDVVIQTGDLELQRLRITLGSYVSELTEKKETLLDRFSRYLKL